jgi:hypothetical protein
MNSDAEQNIQHLRRRLEHGAEEVTRSVLLKLLLAEEKMLGLTEQQLRRIDRHIAKIPATHLRTNQENRETRIFWN